MGFRRPLVQVQSLGPLFHVTFGVFVACKQSERHPCKSGVSFSICTIFEHFRPTAVALDAPKNLIRGWALFFKRHEMHHYFARLIAKICTAYLQILHGLFYKNGASGRRSGYASSSKGRKAPPRFTRDITTKLSQLVENSMIKHQKWC